MSSSEDDGEVEVVRSEGELEADDNSISMALAMPTGPKNNTHIRFTDKEQFQQSRGPSRGGYAKRIGKASSRLFSEDRRRRYDQTGKRADSTSSSSSAGSINDDDEIKANMLKEMGFDTSSEEDNISKQIHSRWLRGIKFEQIEDDDARTGRYWQSPIKQPNGETLVITNAEESDGNTIFSSENLDDDENEEQQEQRLRAKFRKIQALWSEVRACKTCNSKHHSSKNCPHEQCAMCGELDRHETRKCPNVTKCFNCGSVGHAMQNCVYGRRQAHICPKCRVGKHHPIFCPQNWRQYKYTDPSIWRSNITKWCYNCGNSKHYGDDCKERFYKWRYDERTAFNVDNIEAEIVKNPMQFHKDDPDADWFDQKLIAVGLKRDPRTKHTRPVKKYQYDLTISDDNEDSDGGGVIIKNPIVNGKEIVFNTTDLDVVKSIEPRMNVRKRKRDDVEQKPLFVIDEIGDRDGYLKKLEASVVQNTPRNKPITDLSVGDAFNNENLSGLKPVKNSEINTKNANKDNKDLSLNNNEGSPHAPWIRSGATDVVDFKDDVNLDIEDNPYEDEELQKGESAVAKQEDKESKIPLGSDNENNDEESIDEDEDEDMKDFITSNSDISENSWSDDSTENSTIIRGSDAEPEGISWMKRQNVEIGGPDRKLRPRKTKIIAEEANISDSDEGEVFDAQPRRSSRIRSLAESVSRKDKRSEKAKQKESRDQKIQRRAAKKKKLEEQAKEANVTYAEMKIMIFREEEDRKEEARNLAHLSLRQNPQSAGRPKYFPRKEWRTLKKSYQKKIEGGIEGKPQVSNDSEAEFNYFKALR